MALRYSALSSRQTKGQLFRQSPPVEIALATTQTHFFGKRSYDPDSHERRHRQEQTEGAWAHLLWGLLVIVVLSVSGGWGLSHTKIIAKSRKLGFSRQGMVTTHFILLGVKSPYPEIGSQHRDTERVLQCIKVRGHRGKTWRGDSLGDFFISNLPSSIASFFSGV